jgi:phytoene dehydrogenase-like protein
VRSLSDLEPAAAVMFDLAPGAVAEIARDRLPRRVARAYRRYRHGPGSFKVDIAVEGGVPWTNEACRRAGTVHVVGSFEELVVAEREINEGRMPERPLVLVGQQYLADPQRSFGDIHPVWAYAHVDSAVRSPRDFAAYNPNFVGGDILTGANTPVQTAIRPRLGLDPYSTGAPGLYICSAATPPGPGAHGMGGYNAAQSALRHLRTTSPTGPD